MCLVVHGDEVVFAVDSDETFPFRIEALPYLVTSIDEVFGVLNCESHASRVYWQIGMVIALNTICTRFRS